MAELTLKELEKVVAQYVDATKIANASTFNATKDNIIGLIDKIGKIVTLDTQYIDKLSELDGDDLPFGKTIEEYFLDLILPVDYSLENVEQKALKFYSITARPVSYSYSLGKKVIPLSILNNDIERAVNNAEQYDNIITTMTKRLSDSRAMYRYALKREALGTLASKVYDLNDPTNAEATVAEVISDADDFVEGKTYTGTDNAVYLCVTSKESASSDTITTLVEAGVLVQLDMVREIASPVDTQTGEAFIKQVKKDVEIASDVSEGHSLNGNTIGAVEGVRLYVKQGILPELEVDTFAGAFNREDLAVPALMSVVKDFGAKAPTGMYAMLVDYRGVKLDRGYEATRENFNGAGDFVNLFAHSEYTVFVSRNVFVTIYCKPTA